MLKQQNYLIGLILAKDITNNFCAHKFQLNWSGKSWDEGPRYLFLYRSIRIIVNRWVIIWRDTYQS